MKRSRIDYSTIFSPATVLKSTGTSVAGTLPLDTAGLRAMVVRVTATAAGYVRMSTSANPVSASSGDTLVQPGDFLLMRTAGMDYVSFVSESGTATCTVSPQEFGGYVTGSVVIQFSPAMLFTGNTTGAWYDPSDRSTLFQNAAGTLPVTAMEQPVGLMLDKSGKGNHAFNSSGNSANFPVLSARYNLLTKTEQFDDAVWVKTGLNAFGSGSVANTTATSDPLGGNTADFIQENGLTSSHSTYQNLSITAGVRYEYSVYAKTAGRLVQIVPSGTAVQAHANFDIVNGVVGTSANVVSHAITSIGNGWYKCSVVYDAASTTTNSSPSIVMVTSSSAPRIQSYGGDNTSGIYLWGASATIANDALNQPAYQRVNTSTDYDTVGFKPYLRFNGTNQWLQTNSIDFSYGDKMFVSAGVRKLSDAAEQALVEFGTPGVSTNNFWVGASTVSAGYPSSGNYDFQLRGNSTYAGRGATTFSAAITNILSVAYDIAASGAALEVLPRVNGAVPTLTTQTNRTDAGTGNFGNYPLYIGARNASSLWFNGRLYGIVVAGKQASAAEITSTETYINQKTGAF